jgi:hypothetical protein
MLIDPLCFRSAIWEPNPSFGPAVLLVPASAALPVSSPPRPRRAPAGQLAVLATSPSPATAAGWVLSSAAAATSAASATAVPARRILPSSATAASAAAPWTIPSSPSPAATAARLRRTRTGRRRTPRARTTRPRSRWWTPRRGRWRLPRALGRRRRLGYGCRGSGRGLCGTQDSGCHWSRWKVSLLVLGQIALRTRPRACVC